MRTCMPTCCSCRGFLANAVGLHAAGLLAGSHVWGTWRCDWPTQTHATRHHHTSADTQTNTHEHLCQRAAGTGGVADLRASPLRSSGSCQRFPCLFVFNMGFSSKYLTSWMIWMIMWNAHCELLKEIFKNRPPWLAQPARQTGPGQSRVRAHENPSAQARSNAARRGSEQSASCEERPAAGVHATLTPQLSKQRGSVTTPRHPGIDALGAPLIDDVNT